MTTNKAITCYDFSIPISKAWPIVQWLTMVTEEKTRILQQTKIHKKL